MHGDPQKEEHVLDSHIISYLIISYHIVSYRIVSYPTSISTVRSFRSLCMWLLYMVQTRGASLDIQNSLLIRHLKMA